MLLVFVNNRAITQEKQDVYQYKTDEGVTEFTDQVKPEKDLIRHSQIRKMTAEEELLRQEKLDEIIEKDKQADRQRALQNQLEQERRIRQQREKEIERLKKQQAEDSNKKDKDRDVIWLVPPRRHPRPPVKPEHPIEKPPHKPRKKERLKQVD